MKRWTLTLAASLLASALLASALIAAPAVRVLATDEGARLTVRGKLIAAFRVPNRGLSPQDRAEKAADRLRQLLADGLNPGDISIQSRGEAWGVYAGGGLLMIATPDEAALRHEEPETTARRWATNLKEALGGERSADAPAPRGSKRKGHRSARMHVEPTLEVASSSETVPVGATRVVPIRGTARGETSLKVEGEEFVTARLTKNGAAVELKGLNPGKTTIHVLREGKDAALTAWCKKWAGHVTDVPVVEVTGATAPASLVRRVAAARALDGVKREDGASVEVTGPPTGLKALGSGGSAELAFPILISGDGYLPVHTTAKIRVKNRVLTPQEPKLLLYSNEPESVKELGPLYQGVVENTGPVRLFYHHQSKMSRPFTFQVHLVNPSTEPVDVQVIQGDAGPTLDTVEVGHRAGSRYWSLALNDVGYVLHLPARSSRVLYSTQVSNLGTVSGIYTLRILKGEPLVAYIATGEKVEPPSLSETLLTAARNEIDVYPTPKLLKRFAYVVGEHWTFIPLGKDPIRTRDGSKKLFGNYGVDYDLTLDLKNPTPETQKVKLVMSVDAGLACGMFLIDGKVVDTPQTAPPGECDLWSGKLQPGETRTIHVRTLPLGGSAYPVSLVLRPQP